MADKYDDMQGAELEAELKSRDLPHSGTNDEKAARLREDDNSGTPGDEGFKNAEPTAEVNEQTQSIYEPDELLYPDEPHSPENPVKRALTAYEGDTDAEEVEGK